MLLPLEKDFSELMREATSIKRKSSFDDAIDFVINLYTTYDLDDYYKSTIIDRIKTYSKKTQKYSQTDIINISISICESIKNRAALIIAHSTISDLFLSYNEYDKAFQHLRIAISSLNPLIDKMYLFDLAKLHSKGGQIVISSKSKAKNTDYLYFTLMADILSVSNDLVSKARWNMENYLLNLQGHTNLKFIPFSEYIFLQQKALNNDLYIPIQVIDIIAATGYDLDSFKSDYFKLIITDIPQELGFNIAFFDKSFTDLEKLYKILNDLNNGDFVNVAPSKIVVWADKYVNNYLAKIFV